MTSQRTLTMQQLISYFELEHLDPDAVDRRKAYFKDKIRYMLAEEIAKEIKISEWWGRDGLYIEGSFEDWETRALAAEARLRFMGLDE